MKSLHRQPYELDAPSLSRLSRSKSHPRLSTVGLYPTNVVAFSPQAPSTAGQHAAAVFQRAFMICMVVWIGMIAYNAQLVQKLAEVNSRGNSTGRAAAARLAAGALRVKTSTDKSIDGKNING
jgi:hypothetical protein